MELFQVPTPVNTPVQTNKHPFSVGDKTGCVSAVFDELQVNTGTVVCPRSELHVALLLVERKPRNVDLARAQKQSWRDPETVAARRHYDVRQVPAVEILISAKHEHTRTTIIIIIITTIIIIIIIIIIVIARK